MNVAMWGKKPLPNDMDDTAETEHGEILSAAIWIPPIRFKLP